MPTNSHAQPAACAHTLISAPKNPTVEQMAVARNRLLGLVEDFPFADEIDRAVWFAGLMTGAQRHEFDGPAPLFFVEGEPGTGKSLLTFATSVLVTGKPPAVYAPWASDEQASAVLDTVAIRRIPVAVLDGISRPFATEQLAAFLTATHWNFRSLGRAEAQRHVLKTTWWATGTSHRALASGGDLGRRLLRIRLSTKRLQRTRDSFHVPARRQHLVAHLHEYLADITTIRNGFDEHARYNPVAPPRWGAYEGWSDTVRALVIFAGLPDPIGGRLSRGVH